MLWRMSAEPTWQGTGIMLARVDNFSQRHCWVTLRAAAPDVDFPTSMRCERIPRCHDSCARNFSSHASHARPLAIGISLAEIAGTTNSRQRRPARAGPRDWPELAEIAQKSRHGPPARCRIKIEGRAERSETHFSLYRSESILGGAPREQKGQDHRLPRQFVGRPTGTGGREFQGARLLRQALAKPREWSENSQSFQCGKAANPGQWCLLIPAACVPKFCPKF